MAKNLTLLALAVFALICALAAARSALGLRRTAWGILAFGLAAWAVADVIRIGQVRLSEPERFPRPVDYLYLAFSASTVLAMALFPAKRTGQRQLRFALDATTTVLCLSLLLWVTALHRVYDSFVGLNTAVVVTMLFQIGDLVALTIALLALVRADVRDRRVLWLLVAALGLLTVTHNAYALHVAEAGYQIGSMADIGFAAALIAFAGAAILSRRPAPPPRPAAALPLDSSLWLPYVPLLLAGTVGPALIMSGLERVLVPLVVVAVCLRQVLTARENRRLLAAAAEQALRDPLTGLANRTLFFDRLAHAMMLDRHDDRSVTVVSLDLDDFKLVNDSLGHPTADTVLVLVGKRISACVRTGDTVARLGGDEFILLLEGPADHAHMVAERIVAAFAEPFVIDGESMLMRPSVGMAVASSAEPELAPETLVNRADIAMYAAKRSRLTGLHTFSSEMTLLEPDVAYQVDSADRQLSDGVAQVRLLGELRRAVDERGLDVVYQPKLELSTNRIVGLEALLRWPHPQLGELRPDSFMALVRQHGLMRPVTELVLERVFDDAARWASSGLHPRVAVNLFAPLLRDERLPDALRDALDEHGLAPEMLTLKVTEDLALDEVSRVTAVLHRLRRHGIRVAIDDFGSGYSALSYLRDLPIDEVKLDRHFIKSVTRDARAAAVVRAVIDLARDLDISVVAEGVEGAETAVWLREHGCDIGQGYYFGRPAAASEIPQLIGR